MKWEESKFGKFVDEKISYFKYPNTFVCFGLWCNHKRNLKHLRLIGIVNWFSVVRDNTPDLEENYIGLYYIKINNEEHKELAVQIFQNKFKGIYARYYSGLEAVEAYKKYSK